MAELAVVTQIVFIILAVSNGIRIASSDGEAHDFLNLMISVVGCVLGIILVVQLT